MSIAQISFAILYLLKSSYRVALNLLRTDVWSGASSSFSPSGAFWNSIWEVSAPPKIINFLWKIIHNTMASRENLFARKFVSSPLCPMCCVEVESIEHSMFRCDCVTNTRNLCKLADWVFDECLSFGQWIHSIWTLCNFSKELSAMLNRNLFIFENKRFLWGTVSLLPSARRLFKINCDASVKGQNAAVACIIWDSAGVCLNLLVLNLVFLAQSCWLKRWLWGRLVFFVPKLAFWMCVLIPILWRWSLGASRWMASLCGR